MVIPATARSSSCGQILGAWGQFEPVMSQPAGKGATVGFRFRNGRRVHFEAHEVLLPKLLSDVKDYLTSRTCQQIDWQQININSIGFQLVTQNGQQYLGRLVARWELDLEPSAGHFDKQITVSTPLQRAGAYLVTARMDGGNTSNIVLWLDDTVIVKKTVSRTRHECLLFRRRCPHRPARAPGRCRAFRLAAGAG